MNRITENVLNTKLGNEEVLEHNRQREHEMQNRSLKTVGPLTAARIEDKHERKHGIMKTEFLDVASLLRHATAFSPIKTKIKTPCKRSHKPTCKPPRIPGIVRNDDPVYGLHRSTRN